jgi:hypothetical protein
MLPFFLILLTGDAGGAVAPAEDNAERFIRANPVDGGTVGTSLRGSLTLGSVGARLRPFHTE